MRKFPLGQVVATPGALRTLDQLQVPFLELLFRHVSGDWSEMGPEDQQTNEDAVRHGGRVFSAYKLPKGKVVWVITEADRSVTTILLPEEY